MPKAASQSNGVNNELPFAGPNPPVELQVLAPLVGQWNTALDVRVSLQDQEAYSAAGQITRQWLHNRHFIRLEVASTGGKFRSETSVLYGFDAKKRVYRRWLFASSSLATESEGQWDAATQTMTWKPINLAPNVTGGVTDVLTDNRFETTAFLKRNDGTVLTDVTMIATRKK
jgi:hypothetical protein